MSRYQKGKTKKVKTNLDLLEQEIVSGTSANSSSVKSVSQLTVQLTEIGATGPKCLFNITARGHM